MSGGSKANQVILKAGIKMPPSVVPTIAELKSRVPDFCRRYGIKRLEVFGSVARGEAQPGSDIDLLVTFRPEVHPGLDFFFIQDQLEELLGSRVDLLTRRSVELGDNPIRRRSILGSTLDIYAD
jgi:predicted nucleotidyltransferase